MEMSEGISFFMAMPSARAIHFKSGLAPANTLRAFRFYPYCFASAASTHIVKPHIPLPPPKLAKECRCPSPVIDG